MICNTIQKRIVKYETGTVPKKILDANKTYFVVFHNDQKVTTKWKMPRIEINNTQIERVIVFNFLGLTTDAFINWEWHSLQIAHKISCTLAV